MENKPENNEAKKAEAYRKLTKASFFAMISAAALAVCFIVVFGALNQPAAMFAVAAVCMTFATVYYFCQYAMVNKSVSTLVTAIVECLVDVACIVLFILYCVGVM